MKVLCKNVPHLMGQEKYKMYAASLLRSTYAAGTIARKKVNSDAYEVIAIDVKKEQTQEG